MGSKIIRCLLCGLVYWSSASHECDEGVCRCGQRCTEDVTFCCGCGLRLRALAEAP